MLITGTLLNIFVETNNTSFQVFFINRKFKRTERLIQLMIILAIAPQLIILMYNAIFLTNLTNLMLFFVSFLFKEP